MAVGPKVLLLDEPTTAMSFDQSEHFRELVVELAQRGTAIIWVSHHLEELRSTADRVTVMRDGAAAVGAEPRVALPRPALYNSSSATRDQPSRRRVKLTAASRRRCACTNVCPFRGSWLPINLEVKCGEIVGAPGLSERDSSLAPGNISGLFSVIGVYKCRRRSLLYPQHGPALYCRGPGDGA